MIDSKIYHTAEEAMALDTDMLVDELVGVTEDYCHFTGKAKIEARHARRILENEVRRRLKEAQATK